eukprot:TRINITY_DN81064_c0_g1_i1.p1 TRINITY_DN81064_c0_g1~~TRINITY_DN81064_c0_g1_i1.p1  ORF type:complete len:330 (+),score=103.30 TRINITY_DN81064_c0_g1_i1:86-991(+)
MGRRKRGHKTKPSDAPMESDEKPEEGVETRNIWEYTEEELAELEGLKIADAGREPVPEESVKEEKTAVSGEGVVPAGGEHELEGEMEDESLPKAERKRLRNLRRKQKRQELAEKEHQRAVEAASRLRDLKGEEKDSLKRMLFDRGLEIVPIPSDGNCLYAAVADQLRRESLGEVDLGVTELREICAQEMRMNKDEHAGFIELPNGWSFDDYIERAVLKSGYWGGHVEMLSLANAFSASIEVLCAGQEPIIVGEGSNYRLTIAYLKKAFTLGEHYNSVTRIERSHLHEEDLQEKDEEDSLTE